MKKLLIFPLLLTVFLAGCSGLSVPSSDSVSSLEESLALAHLARAEAEEKAAYYQALVQNLEAELLQVKTDFYQERIQYESRIEELEASVNLPTTDSSSPFQFTSENGTATLIGYIGNEREVTIPSVTPDGIPITAIADRAFENNINLTAVTVPTGVKQIGWFAFSGCISLSRIALPASVSDIGYGAFLNCPATLTVKCPEGSYAEAYALSYGMITIP